MTKPCVHPYGEEFYQQDADVRTWRGCRKCGRLVEPVTPKPDELDNLTMRPRRPCGCVLPEHVCDECRDMPVIHSKEVQYDF